MRHPAVAERDIECYKVVLRPRGMRRGKYLSWFRDFEYRLGEKYREPKFEAAAILDPDFGEGNINNGFHSYTNENFAHCFLRGAVAAVASMVRGAVIVRCVIPAGARYYVSALRDQYCSDTLRIDAQLVKGEWVKEFPGKSE